MTSRVGTGVGSRRGLASHGFSNCTAAICLVFPSDSGGFCCSRSVAGVPSDRVPEKICWEALVGRAARWLVGLTDVDRAVARRHRTEQSKAEGQSRKPMRRQGALSSLTLRSCVRAAHAARPMQSPPRSRRHAKTQVGSPRSTVTDTSRTSRGECGAVHQQTDRQYYRCANCATQRTKTRPPPIGLPSCPSQPAPRPSPPPPTMTFVCPPARLSLVRSHHFVTFSREESHGTRFFRGWLGGKKSVGLRRKVTPFETRPAQSPTAQSDIRQWVTDCLFGLRARVPIRR